MRRNGRRLPASMAAISAMSGRPTPSSRSRRWSATTRSRSRSTRSSTPVRRRGSRSRPCRSPGPWARPVSRAADGEPPAVPETWSMIMLNRRRFLLSSAAVVAAGAARRLVAPAFAADAPTLIHWHGLKPPYRQDGVPDVAAPLVAPGDAADYDFPLAFPGTFWMHSHQSLQEQRMMAAPLIIRDGSRAAGQEIVMMLHDFA